MARSTCLRILTATTLFAAEAVLGTSLLAIAPAPAGAQLFDDRFPFQSRRQRGPFEWFEPAPQQQQQERAPVELRGRVFAVQLMLSNFASIVPLLLLGGLGDLIGIDKTLLLIGCLIGCAGVVSTRIAPGEPPWRRAREQALEK